MKTRADIIRLISYHITNGKGVKIHLDGHDLRLQFTDRPYMIWHDETDGTIAAIIYEEDLRNHDIFSAWAKEAAYNIF